MNENKDTVVTTQETAKKGQTAEEELLALLEELSTGYLVNMI